MLINLVIMNKFGRGWVNKTKEGVEENSFVMFYCFRDFAFRRLILVWFDFQFGIVCGLIYVRVQSFCEGVMQRGTVCFSFIMFVQYILTLFFVRGRSY